MQRQQPISPFAMQQPYSRAGGQAPGPALSAMLAGRTLFGMNPMDAQRGAQRTARPGAQHWQSLLASLLR
jgi:hypothetical protein